MTLVRRGTRLAVGTLLIVSVICIGGFLLGGVGAAVAVGSVMLAFFRLWIIGRTSAALVDEIQTMISNDPASERVVIETVESSDDVQDQSAVVMSRQFFAMGDTAAVRTGQFGALALALRGVTSFPLLMLLATAITVGFAGLSVLFLLGLVF